MIMLPKLTSLFKLPSLIFSCSSLGPKAGQLMQCNHITGLSFHGPTLFRSMKWCPMISQTKVDILTLPTEATSLGPVA